MTTVSRREQDDEDRDQREARNREDVRQLRERGRDGAGSHCQGEG
jgi:hypothetical protein